MNYIEKYIELVEDAAKKEISYWKSVSEYWSTKGASPFNLSPFKEMKKNADIANEACLHFRKYLFNNKIDIYKEYVKFQN